MSILWNTVNNAKAQVIFAHGAGANMNHEFMNEMSALFNNLGINVLRFNFPFMDKRALTGKRYPPDRMPKLLACYKAVIHYLNAENTKQTQQGLSKHLPLFIGGKSMGSRVAATLVAKKGNVIEPDDLTDNELNSISGVFCFGYPFHPTKKPDKLRLEPLQSSAKPILIVQGERDTLGDKAEIIDYQLPEHCQCVFLDDGDHSLKPRVKSGFTYAEHMKGAAKEVTAFIEHLTSQ
ncbi:hypothetical protein CWS31_010565 [Colwellia echini]|uniref:KANL3/Tex30 alpha/beta hydrolase-like domain-containing protein n=1 Tax=Colwellia echini TaxID=1982103 RepID=A0ABY3MWG0_9GAMM|nr:hypothetical protein CWS31_010565 [Colwellia echini]